MRPACIGGFVKYVNISSGKAEDIENVALFFCCLQAFILTILSKNKYSRIVYTHQFISSIISCLTHEGEVIPVHALKSGGVSRGVAPLIINLSTRWRWVVSFTSWLIYPQGKEYLVLVGGWVDPRDGLDILEKRASRFKPHIVQFLARPVY